MGIYIANDIIPLEVWKQGGGGEGRGEEEKIMLLLITHFLL